MYYFTMLVFISAVVTVTVANDDVFRPGSVIKEFGKVADVESDVKLPASTVFKVRFDVGRSSRPGSINQTFDSAARFINLNVAAGVAPENIAIAIVVHGSAASDVTKDSFYASKKENQKNASAAAVKVLQQHNVDFYICGQSAAYQGIEKDNLLEGVKLAPSAMTMHAVLDQQGFTLNPF